MFFAVAYLTAPLISFLAYVYLNGKEKGFEYVKENPLKSAMYFLSFFVIDNIIISALVTLFKGRINTIGYMMDSSKFMAIYLFCSAVIGAAVPVILKNTLSAVGNVDLRINESNERIISNFFVYAFGIIGIILALIQCFDNNFWGDECAAIHCAVYSNSFLEAIRLDARTIAPFYYTFLRALTLVLGKYPFVYHLTSAIPAIILLIFSMVFLKKKFGAGTSCIFSLMMIMTDIGRTYAVEVRMYEWAALFVTFCLYEGYQLSRGGVFLTGFYFA